MASIRDGELLGELEDEVHEFEDEGPLHEDELEAEGIFGAIGSALSGLLGESEEEAAGMGEFEEELAHEGEFEDELAHEGEFEDELAHEGEFEDELAHEGEFEDELAHEYEDEGEAFLRRFRIRLPSLRQLVKFAAPAIATAFGGPLGGRLASMVTRNLEGEFEGEEEATEAELEIHEGEYEAHAEIHSEAEAQAELMAAAASEAASEAEAEALIGAATWAVLSRRERHELRRALPHMVRATAILTRLLRRRRSTRPIVRTMPYITKLTAGTLLRQRQRTGRPITRAQAARVMTAHTRRVFGRPRYCSMALRRNVHGARRMQRVARVPVRGVPPMTTSARRRRVRY